MHKGGKIQPLVQYDLENEEEEQDQFNLILKKKSAFVKKMSPEIRQLAKDMLVTMYANHGIGLAAVQIGVHKRVVVIDIDSSINAQIDHEEKIM